MVHDTFEDVLNHLAVDLRQLRVERRHEVGGVDLLVDVDVGVEHVAQLLALVHWARLLVQRLLVCCHVCVCALYTAVTSCNQ